jgi:hypothetical protein
MVKPDLVAARAQQAHIQQMQAEVEKMRAKLEQMKATLVTMNAGPNQDQARLDVEMWESLVSHLEGMVKMMSDPNHGGMGHMGMMHDDVHHEGGMDCCAGMGKDGCCSGGKCMKEGAQPAPAAPDKP